MRKLIKHKVWVVWLLAAVLALPFASKTIHTYQNNIHEEHDNCPVCQFTLSTFTEATFIDYDFSIIPVRFEPAVPYRNPIYQRIFIPYGLRAPPIA